MVKHSCVLLSEAAHLIITYPVFSVGQVGCFCLLTIIDLDVSSTLKHGSAHATVMYPFFSLGAHWLFLLTYYYMP